MFLEMLNLEIIGVLLYFCQNFCGIIISTTKVHVQIHEFLQLGRCSTSTWEHHFIYFAMLSFDCSLQCIKYRMDTYLLSNTYEKVQIFENIVQVTHANDNHRA